MGGISKQLAIYLALLLVCACYTMIAPFYPEIAARKGLPLWMIGAVFSTDPLLALITSIFIGKYMNLIGRKTIILVSLLFVAGSMFVLSPIETCEKSTVIFLSFASRILAGIGSGCIMTAADTIFTSDYPDQLETMIGRMEGAIGVGLIIGPLLGTAMYVESLFIALVAFGFVILLYIPIAWLMLGTFRTYTIHNQKISSLKLMLKPVKLT